MSSPPRRRRWLAWLGIAIVVMTVAAGGAALYLSSAEQDDVVNADVPFDERGAAPAPAGQAGAGRPADFDWPLYGYDKARTRYLPLKETLRPPFAERWKVGGSILLEFPPAMGGQSLYLLKNNGALYGLSRKTGRIRWKRKLGYLAASQPAYADGVVYVVVLERGKGVGQGRVAAIRARDGSTKWSRKLPSRAESSPMLDRGTLSFGSEDGTVYGLRASDGFTRWRFRADGAVKGGLALDGDKLFFGDYAGKVYAIRAATGRRVWEKDTRGARFGLSAGNFYSTPAAAYGRIYLGNTDGFVYSFATRDGALAWRKRTGGFVYGSPAVARVPGGKPTVYIGSYDKRFYALDARTGRERWRRKAEGRISGGATVLGDLVFYSTLAKTTTALGARSGQKVWSTKRGAFNAVVSNGRGIFLIGMTSLFGLDGRPGAPRAVDAPGTARGGANRAERRRAA
ncbi:MAG: PQQ-binding-like beta-propeller repeat protein, partial [Actinomycetota bacterium]|nr:PQQ-binding-like beta-propeller repeat protein [Actinomycetota bacterium]